MKLYSDEESPKGVWLSPQCDEANQEGRIWCRAKIDDCPECGSPSVHYIRADLSDAMLDALKEALVFLEDEVPKNDTTVDGSFTAEARALSDRIAAVIKQAQGEL